MNSLRETDPEIYSAIVREVNRIEHGVELIHQRTLSPVPLCRL